jgi:integrase
MASIVRRRGSKLWTAFFRDQNGKQHCRSTEETNKKRAQKIADEWEAAGQNKRTLRATRRVLAQMHELISGSKLEEVSCRAHFNEWLAVKKPEIGSRTYDFYEASVNKFLASLGSRAEDSIAEITRADLVAYRNGLAKSLRAKTVNHRLKALKMIFRAAKRDGLIAEDPCEFVDTVKVQDSGKRRGFTKEEIASVLSVADPEWESLIKFGLYTGQRLGDLARLTWANVDQQRNELRLVPAKTAAKTGKTLILPLAESLRKHVEALPPADSLDVPIHPKAYAIATKEKRSGSLSNQFADLLAQAGLRTKKTHKKLLEGRSAKRAANELSFHSLRHSTVSFLHQAGLSQATVMAFVGHESKAVNDHYTHVGSAELTRAAAALPEV